MIQVRFKNLERSELVTNAVHEKVTALVNKFDDLEDCKITVTLEMENSPIQAGPDLFTTKLHVENGRYRNVTVTKSHSNLYVALADMMDHMLEVLNRLGDKKRVKNRALSRLFAKRCSEPELDR